jgi:hypothetical protein
MSTFDPIQLVISGSSRATRLGGKSARFPELPDEIRKEGDQKNGEYMKRAVVGEVHTDMSESALDCGAPRMDLTRGQFFCAFPRIHTCVSIRSSIGCRLLLCRTACTGSLLNTKTL